MQQRDGTITGIDAAYLAMVYNAIIPLFIHSILRIENKIKLKKCKKLNNWDGISLCIHNFQRA